MSHITTLGTWNEDTDTTSYGGGGPERTAYSVMSLEDVRDARQLFTTQSGSRFVEHELQRHVIQRLIDNQTPADYYNAPLSDNDLKRLFAVEDVGDSEEPVMWHLLLERFKEHANVATQLIFQSHFWPVLKNFLISHMLSIIPNTIRYRLTLLATALAVARELQDIWNRPNLSLQNAFANIYDAIQRFRMYRDVNVSRVPDTALVILYQDLTRLTPHVNLDTQVASEASGVGGWVGQNGEQPVEEGEEVNSMMYGRPRMYAHTCGCNYY